MADMISDAPSSEPEVLEVQPIIEVSDLWRIYRLGVHQEISALRGVNLRIEAGHFIAVKGRSGSGKTTLLNCIGGLDKPTSGSVCVFGTDLSDLSEKQLTRFYREKVGFIFQDFSLSPIYSVYENVEIILRIGGMSQRECRERVLSCIQLVGLTKWMNHRSNELSGGQQQRVAIARALVNRPKLILADEPTGKLDTTTAREIFALFRDICDQQNITILVASHDPLIAEYVDYVINIKDGQILLNPS